MRVLVCVKRVPLTGGAIVLTDDGQAIDTRHLGFTISPHEECGVEEAVRLVEANGGESAVLTLGPPEAEAERFDALLELMVDRTQLQIILEIFERGLDLDELDIELPKLGRIATA